MHLASSYEYQRSLLRSQFFSNLLIIFDFRKQVLETIIHPPPGLKYEGNDNLEENSKQIFSDSLHPDRSVHIGSQIQVAASNIYVKYPTGRNFSLFFRFYFCLI